MCTRSIGLVLIGVVAAPLVPCTPARADAVAFWHFDETPGSTIAVDSAGDHDGALFGSATFESGGVAGGCVHVLRTGNGFVDVGDYFRFTNSDFALVAWARTASGDTTINYSVLVKHRATLMQGYFLGINYNEGGYGTPDKAWFYQSCYPPLAPISTTSVNDGAWHQIVAVYRAARSARIFVDGAPYEHSAPAVPIVGNDAHLTVGAVDFGGTLQALFTGWVDEVQLYDHYLTATQVQYLFEHPTLSVLGPLGDLNCDGVFDFNDINPFVLALSDPAGYTSEYPGCHIARADFTLDGVIDFGDISPYVEALSE